MTIQSLSYFAFLAVMVVLASVTRAVKARQLLLLAASYAFYATYGLGFLGILVASSIMNYLLGGFVRKNPNGNRLWVGVLANVALLGVFKYLPPVAVNVGWMPKLLMPVGISFWTFQGMSYLFDLYREEDIDPSPIEFCLYMAFWPTVLSGPVCRMPEMLPQFREAKAIAWDDLAVGLKRIIIGLFMKVVLSGFIANGLNAGEGVNTGFDQIAGGWGGIDVWMLAIGYAMQLYFDFAGYSHIVIGSARLLGLELAENFERPYWSNTPSIFWTKWHMSLSFWIRDYLFMNIATIRREMWWRNGALAFSMTLFGLWHAATWPFVLWGAYHGVVLVGHRLVQQTCRNKNIELPGWLTTVGGWMLTFALVCVGWIFFRVHDAHQAFAMIKALVNLHGYRHLTLRPNFYYYTALITFGYFVVSGIGILWEKFDPQSLVHKLTWALSPAYYAAAIMLIVLWSKQEAVFVYFQF